MQNRWSIQELAECVIEAARTAGAKWVMRGLAASECAAQLHVYSASSWHHATRPRG